MSKVQTPDFRGGIPEEVGERGCSLGWILTTPDFRRGVVRYADQNGGVSVRP